jgi:hypothetical protein
MHYAVCRAKQTHNSDNKRKYLPQPQSRNLRALRFNLGFHDLLLQQVSVLRFPLELLKDTLRCPRMYPLILLEKPRWRQRTLKLLFHCDELITALTLI